jgi:hypothetical protein
MRPCGTKWDRSKLPPGAFPKPCVAGSNPAEGALERYHSDTICGMAMTLRLTEDEQAALRERAETEGISMQEAARRAVRDYVAHGRHRDRVSAAATRVMDAHAEALQRLGE